MSLEHIREALAFAQRDVDQLSFRVAMLMSRNRPFTLEMEKLLYARGRVEFWKAVGEKKQDQEPYEVMVIERRAA